MLASTFAGVARDSWAVWGTWAEVGVTALVGGGALWIAWIQVDHLRRDARRAASASEDQLRAIREQIEAGNRNHEEALKLASKPEVVGLEAGYEKGRPFLRLKNIGAGPALDVRYGAWAGEYVDGDDEASRAKEVLAGGELESSQHGGIAPGDTVTHVFAATAPLDAWFFAAKVSYSDVRRNQRFERRLWFKWHPGID